MYLGVSSDAQMGTPTHKKSKLLFRVAPMWNFATLLLRRRIDGRAPSLNGYISLMNHIQDGHLSAKCCLGVLDIGSKERFRGPQNVYRVLSQGQDYYLCRYLYQ